MTEEAFQLEQPTICSNASSNALHHSCARHYGLGHWQEQHAFGPVVLAAPLP